MANEATIVNRFSAPISMDCTDAVPMEKGTLLMLSGPRGVFPSEADNNAAGGILHREKIAGTGRTTCSVYHDGIFRCKVVNAGVAIDLGAYLTISGPNTLKNFTTLDDEKGFVFGTAMEVIAAGVTDTIEVKLGR